MKYDIIIGNPPYQETVSNKKTQTIWGKVVVNEFNLIKPKGIIANVHPSGWRFVTSRSKKELIKVSQIYRNNTILYMEFNDVKQGIETFGASTDYDVVVIRKEQSDGNCTIKTKTDGLINVNLNDYTVIPTDNFELYNKLIDNG